MQRQISTGAGIVVIAAVAFVSALVAIWIIQENIVKIVPDIASQQEKDALPKRPLANDENGKQKACLDSGGTVSASLCCGQAQDFPNNCAIGACGCALASSHQVKTCECGEGKCFDGNSCVSQSRGSNTAEPVFPGSQKKCSMDAKVCPDGSSVGRTGPNCEFTSCP